MLSTLTLYGVPSGLLMVSCLLTLQHKRQVPSVVVAKCIKGRIQKFLCMCIFINVVLNKINIYMKYPTYCSFPFESIAPKSWLNGRPHRVTPCCNMKTDTDDPMGVQPLIDAGASLEEIFMSKQFTELRRDLLSGVQNPASLGAGKQVGGGLFKGYVAFTPSYSINVQSPLGASKSALASPPPIKRMNDCLNTWKHLGSEKKPYNKVWK